MAGKGESLSVLYIARRERVFYIARRERVLYIARKVSQERERDHQYCISQERDILPLFLKEICVIFILFSWLATFDFIAAVHRLAAKGRREWRDTRRAQYCHTVLRIAVQRRTEESYIAELDQEYGE